MELQRRAARTEPEWIFADLYSSLLISDEYQVIDIKISSDGKTEWVFVELIQPTELCTIFQKNHVLFRVVRDGTSRSEQSAFSVLMQGARAIDKKEKEEKQGETLPSLPEHMVVNNKKDQLHNDILCFLKNKGVSFRGKTEASTSGKQFVKTLVNVLWYVDGHQHKLKAFSEHHSQVPSFPDALEAFSNYNDVIRKKKSTRLDQNSLSIHAHLLFGCLSEVWMERSEWKEVRDITFNLATLAMEYCKHLAKENETQKRRHERESPSRSHKDDSESKEIESTLGPVKEQYVELDKLIATTSEYEMVELDRFTPTDSQKRYTFIRQLKLSSPVMLYRYHRSSSLGTINWIWKLPVDKKQRSNSATLKNIAEIQEMFPETHTRKMRREFKDRYHLFTKLTPLLLTDMYRSLTKDASVVPNQKVLDRLNMLVDSDYIHCEDVIVDLRAQNEGRPSQFEKFWSGLGKVLNEYCEAAADSRRHGAATTPLAISIPDLKQRVIESFDEQERSELSVPSDSAVRLQFLPKNPRAECTKLYWEI